MNKRILTAGLALTILLGAGSSFAAEENCVHRVIKGDTLWHISDTYLDKPYLWPQVWKNNPDIQNPHLIFPDQLVKIPGATSACTEYKCLHHVVKGDTLWHISGIYLEKPYLWPRIWKQNPQVRNPDLIFPGQQLNVPCPPAAPPTAEQAAPAPAPVAAAPEPEITSLSDGGGLAVFEPGALFKTDEIDLTGFSKARLQTISSGRLVQELPSQGRVFKSVTGWDYTGDEERLVVKATDATAGKAYGVYRDLGVIRHPKTGKKVGNLIMEVGIVEIAPGGDGQQIALVKRAFQEIENGDVLGPVPELPVLQAAAARTNRPASLNGTVVAVENRREVAGSNDILYIDAGTQAGLIPGDRLVIRNQDEKLAEAMVMRVTPTTATALVSAHSMNYITPGNLVALAGN